MKYTVKSESGKQYAIEKAGGLWVVKEQYPILWLGNERKISPNTLTGKILINVHQNKGSSTDGRHIKVYDGSIEQALLSKDCIGKQIFYAHPNSYNELIRYKNQVNRPEVYSRIVQHLGITTKIKDIF